MRPETLIAAVPGSEDVHDEPAVEPFFLSKYEMTQAQWERFTGTNPSQFQRPTLPVTDVSWSDCVEVVRKLALVLPHEVQWEHAARAGTATAWWTGQGDASLEGAMDWPAWRTMSNDLAANPWL